MYERSLQDYVGKWPLGRRWKDNTAIIVGREALRKWIGFRRLGIV
jgi:hypothetical protein